MCFSGLLAHGIRRSPAAARGGRGPGWLAEPTVSSLSPGLIYTAIRKKKKKKDYWFNLT